MWNLVLGGVFLVGGLSGKLALFGTDSSAALAVVGAGLMGWGAWQLFRAKSQR